MSDFTGVMTQTEKQNHILSSSAGGLQTVLSPVLGESKERGDALPDHQLPPSLAESSLSRHSGLKSCVGRTGLLKDVTI